MNEPIYSVKDVTKYIKTILEHDPNLTDVWIRGEISNYTLHQSGHMYFSIKDEKSVMKAVMFAGNTRSLRFIPKEGVKVIVRGNIQLYEPSGQYQIVAREMQEDGVGNLHLAFEELKKKLQAEGLFSEEYKKPIPPFPKSIGIITSPTGAAVHDMITTIKRRYPIADILLYPVQVQGVSAPASIVKAIQDMNEYGKSDVLIVGRGGGSIEDLWGFNDEKVARAIFSSVIPVISAVGHETDFTIADFVADLRAPTPTGAAELATPYTVVDLQQNLLYYQSKMKRELLNKLQNSQEKLKRLNQAIGFYHPKKVHENNIQKHDMLHEQLVKIMEKHLGDKKQHYLLNLTKLDGLSPVKIMSRGFSAVYKGEQLVKEHAQVKPNDKVTIHLQDGLIDCTVDQVHVKNEEEAK